MSLFSQTVGARPKSNAFNLSHERKFSMKMGDLVPILCEEIIPGDKWQCNTEVLMRLAPMVAPIMHRVNVFTHFFFVPNRIIWDDWEDFITGGEDGTEEPVMPYREFTSGWSSYFGEGKLLDYLGFSAEVPTSTVRINTLPLKAYQTIYNEYYRDQNIQTALTIDKTSGADTTSIVGLTAIRKRAWEKDYFTSALPWTQRGGDVNLPLSGTAPVRTEPENGVIYEVSGGGNPATGAVSLNASDELTDSASNEIEPTNLVADVDQVTLGTIEELRRATKLQQWLERNARGGSRYIEQILVHFGVLSSDARLQRPEFLGGGKTPIVISEVLQTSSTDLETPQGNMAGHALAVGNSHKFTKKFEEHGYIIGIMSVLPKTAYQQGTRKHLFKDDKFDYFWPEFSQLGEQPVLQGELYDDYVTANRTGTFGYQSRYAEYKYIPSSVHGTFKGNQSFWHMGRIFDTAPQLNEEFIQADTTDINERAFAAGDTEDQLWVQVYHNIKAIRPIPKINNPSLL